jgi:hypothetical protein
MKSFEEVKAGDKLLVGGRVMFVGWFDGQVAMALETWDGGGRIRRLSAEKALQARRDYLAGLELPDGVTGIVLKSPGQVGDLHDLLSQALEEENE